MKNPVALAHNMFMESNEANIDLAKVLLKEGSEMIVRLLCLVAYHSRHYISDHGPKFQMRDFFVFDADIDTVNTFCPCCGERKFGSPLLPSDPKDATFEVRECLSCQSERPSPVVFSTFFNRQGIEISGQD